MTYIKKMAFLLILFQYSTFVHASMDAVYDQTCFKNSQICVRVGLEGHNMTTAALEASNDGGQTWSYGSAGYACPTGGPLIRNSLNHITVDDNGRWRGTGGCLADDPDNPPYQKGVGITAISDDAIHWTWSMDE